MKLFTIPIRPVIDNIRLVLMRLQNGRSSYSRCHNSITSIAGCACNTFCTYVKSAGTIMARAIGAGTYCLILMLVVSACLQEKIIPVAVNFTYQVKNEDYSIPVEIIVSNLTTGAENYRWTFEGGEPATSDLINPGKVLFSQAGTYKIKLEAWNEDDRQAKEITLQLLGTVAIDFETEIAINNISPVTVTLTNKTRGGTAYHWKFPNATPSSYTGYDPPTVVYATPGNHAVTLIVENGTEKDSLAKVITVQPALVADFTIEPSFADEDYEAPLDAVLVNNTVGGLSYTWSAPGGQLSSTTQQQPTVHFSLPGTYTVTLTATNQKETKSVSRDITVLPNTWLRTHTNVKLGINTAHKTIGCFYSTALRRVMHKNDPDSLGKYVDLAFFGVNAGFTFNRFVSPDSVQDYTFDAIPGAQKTHFINSLDKCNCAINFTDIDFDQMINDTPLKNLDIQSLATGLKPFDSTQVPRIVLFMTSDGRKGAIKIKSFYSDGQQSYIVIDIKVQKQ